MPYLRIKSSNKYHIMKKDLLADESLLATIRSLRGSQGCPWDQKQTSKSLKKYLREEVDELMQAIDNEDSDNICEEIGDITYILMMISEICRDNGLFTYTDCLSGINDKLIRRHPHVFGDANVKDEEQLRQQWETIKQQEKKQNH